MTQTLVVIGATGQQGGSVVRAVLADPVLSKEFRVRAVTRDPGKAAARALADLGAEVVRGDVADRQSLDEALNRVDVLFYMTGSVYSMDDAGREGIEGRNIADAAVAAGAKYIIFSSIPHAGRISGGALDKVLHFDVKAEIEDYIRTLPVKSAFFHPASFMQNFHSRMGPRPVGDGTYAMANILKPTTPIPLIDVVDDTGKFVGSILAEPDKYQGQVFSAATRLYTFQEITEIMSKATGKTVRYNELPVDVYRGFMRPGFADPMVQMMLLIRDYGYYGPEQEQKVEWTAKQARGKLTTLEDYLAKNPLTLE